MPPEDLEFAITDMKSIGLTTAGETFIRDRVREPYNEKVSAEAAFNVEMDKQIAAATDKLTKDTLIAAKWGHNHNEKFKAIASYLYLWPFPDLPIANRTVNGIPLLFAFKLNGETMQDASQYVSYWLENEAIKWPDIPIENLYADKAYQKKMWGIFLDYAPDYKYFLRAIKYVILASKSEFPLMVDEGTWGGYKNQDYTPKWKNSRIEDIYTTSGKFVGKRGYPFRYYRKSTGWNGWNSGYGEVAGINKTAANIYSLIDFYPHTQNEQMPIQRDDGNPYKSGSELYRNFMGRIGQPAHLDELYSSRWFRAERGAFLAGAKNRPDIFRPYIAGNSLGFNYNENREPWKLGDERAILSPEMPWKRNANAVAQGGIANKIVSDFPLGLAFDNEKFSTLNVYRGGETPLFQSTWKTITNTPFASFTTFSDEDLQKFFALDPATQTYDDPFVLFNSLTLLDMAVQMEIVWRFNKPKLVVPSRGFFGKFLQYLPFILPIFAVLSLPMLLLKELAVLAGQQAAKAIGGIAGMIVGAIVGGGVEKFGGDIFGLGATPFNLSPEQMGMKTYDPLSHIIAPEFDVIANFGKTTASMSPSMPFTIPSGDYSAIANLNYGSFTPITAPDISALAGSGFVSGLTSIPATSSSLIGTSLTSFSPVTAASLTASGFGSITSAATTLADWNYLAPLTASTPTFTSPVADFFKALTAPTTGTVSALNNFIPAVSGSAGQYASLATLGLGQLPTGASSFGSFASFANLSLDAMPSTGLPSLMSFTPYDPTPSLQQAFNPQFVTGLSTPAAGTLAPSYKLTEELRQFLPVSEPLQQVLGKGLDAAFQNYIGLTPEMLSKIAMSSYLQAGLIIAGAVAPNAVKYPIAALSLYENREALMNPMDFTASFLPAVKDVALTALPQFKPEIRVAYEVTKFLPELMNYNDLLSRIPELLGEGVEELVKGIVRAPELAVKGLTYLGEHVEDLPPLVVKGAEYVVEKLPPLAIEGVQETVKFVVEVPEYTIKAATFVMDKAPPLIMEGLTETGKAVLEVPELAVKGLSYTAEKLPPLVMEGLQETGVALLKTPEYIFEGLAETSKVIIKAPEYIFEGLSETAKFLGNLEMPAMGGIEIPSFGTTTSFGLAPLSSTMETIAVVTPNAPTTFTQQPVPTSTAANGETIIHLPMQEIRVSLWPMVVIGAAAALVLVAAADKK